MSYEITVPSKGDGDLILITLGLFKSNKKLFTIVNKVFNCTGHNNNPAIGRSNWGAVKIVCRPDQAAMFMLLCELNDVKHDAGFDIKSPDRTWDVSRNATVLL